jgi:hypothetical protein
MRETLRIIGLLSLIVVFGRMFGGGGDWVMFHPDGTDMSYAAKTTISGYFVVELPPGPCLIETINGFSRTVVIPTEGMLIWESGDSRRGLESAVFRLQEITGLR